MNNDELKGITVNEIPLIDVLSKDEGRQIRQNIQDPQYFYRKPKTSHAVSVSKQDKRPGPVRILLNSRSHTMSSAFKVIEILAKENRKMLTTEISSQLTGINFNTLTAAISTIYTIFTFEDPKLMQREKVHGKPGYFYILENLPGETVRSAHKYYSIFLQRKREYDRINRLKIKTKSLKQQPAHIIAQAPQAPQAPQTFQIQAPKIQIPQSKMEHIKVPEQIQIEIKISGKIEFLFGIIK